MPGILPNIPSRKGSSQSEKAPNSSDSNSNRVTSTPVTSTPVTSTPVTSTPVTSTPVTSTPLSKSLLWVNKDAQSASLSNSKDNPKTINTHVQRRYFQSRREQRLSRLRSSLPAKSLVDKRLVVRKPGEDDEEKPASAVEKRRRQPVAESQLCKANFTRQACIDPFDMAPLPLDGEAHKIIQYFFDTNVSSSFKSEVAVKSSNRPHRHSSQIEQTFNGCVTNRVHMSAFLAVNSGRMIYITGVEPQTMRFAQAQAYMYRAMKDLRKHFTSTQDVLKDKQIVLTMIWVMTYEWYFGNWDAVLTHMNVIKLLLEIMSQEEETAYSRYLMDVSARSDVYLATELLSKPIFPVGLTKAAGQYPKWGKVPSSPLGEGFATALKKKQFGKIMGSIVEEVIRCLRIRRFVETSPDSGPEDTAWIGQQIHDIMYRLLSVGLDDRLTQAEECIRIALIILFCHVTTFTVKRSGPRNAIRLQSALRAVPLGSFSRTGIENEILIWVLLTGMFASEKGSEVADWFTYQAVKTALVVGVGDLCQLMERYFWIEKLQASSVKRLSTLLELFDSDHDSLDEGKPQDLAG